jgi:hypothetical protein
MIRSARRVTAFCAVVMAARGHSLSGQEVGERSVAGTYAITICQNICRSSDPSTAVARGHLVLEADAFSLSSLPDDAERYFRDFGTINRGDEGRGPPNACFVLERTTTRTLAGLQPVGVTRWSRAAGDTLMVKIAQLTDAGYNAWLTIGSRGLTGRGRGWAHGESANERKYEEIRGRRIGPPDRSRCVRAALSRAALLRSPPPPRPAS